MKIERRWVVYKDESRGMMCFDSYKSIKRRWVWFVTSRERRWVWCGDNSIEKLIIYIDRNIQVYKSTYTSPWHKTSFLCLLQVVFQSPWASTEKKSGLWKPVTHKTPTSFSPWHKPMSMLPVQDINMWPATKWAHLYLEQA